MPIHITHEELAFLSRLMGKPSLRGLPLQLPGEHDQVTRALVAAENSLRARGWLRLEGDSISLDKTVLDAIAFLASAPVVFGIRRTPRGAATDSHLFYLSHALKLHVHVDAGVYSIDTYNSDGFDDALRAVRGADSGLSGEIRPSISGMPLGGFVGLAALAQMKDATREAVLEGLSAQNLGFEQAGVLFDLYREDWEATVNLSAWLEVGAEVDATLSTLTLLDTRQGWWRIVQPTPDNVDLLPLTDYQVEGLVEAVLERIFDAVKG